MISQNIGRLPVVEKTNHEKVIGILTRGDILSAENGRLRESKTLGRSIVIKDSLRSKTQRAKKLFQGKK
jgi:CBS domain-containing protein